MCLLSRTTFVLFERKCPAKWTSPDIPPWFRCICSIQRALKYARREFKLYLFTELYDVYEDAAGSGASPWINVPKWSKLQRISPAQGVGSNKHCVGIISIRTVHARSSLLTSWLSESGVLTKQDMQNMQSVGGTGIGKRCSKMILEAVHCCVVCLIVFSENKLSLCVLFSSEALPLVYAEVLSYFTSHSWFKPKPCTHPGPSLWLWLLHVELWQLGLVNITKTTINGLFSIAEWPAFLLVDLTRFLVQYPPYF